MTPAKDPKALYNQHEACWRKYVRGRPAVPDAFFSRILAYHTVHDIGAGIGIHTGRRGLLAGPQQRGPSLRGQRHALCRRRRGAVRL